MGCYDSFYARCAKCGTEIEVQLKDFDCCCDSFRKGDIVDLREAPNNFLIESPHSCYYCGYVNTVVVQDRIFKGFLK